MRPINPYIVGNPVKDSSSFYGRQDIFREVMQVLHQRDSHAIVLYGQRRIGKTSMLLQLEQRLKQEGEFTPIYFDLQDKASKPLLELLFELAQHISRVTGHTMQQSADFDRTGDYFRDTFLPGIAERVKSGGLVLLFDEFDVLDSPSRTQASQAFFPYLRTWMENVQKVKFVFVIGRRPEELSVRSMATFKGIQSTRVSFMSREETDAVIRQSEQAGSLTWEPDAVKLVYEYTHGHPYFTQLLSSVVWENDHEDDTEDNPTATAEEVYKGVDQALKMGANAFNWLWDGLPPAERVVMSAMAEVNDEIITQDQLIETLNQSGVRLIARELELAPETLMDWELLYRVENGYRFSVPLLRRWVLANRPLRRVKDELDRLDPLADTLFQAGQGFYNSNRLADAEQQLRQAININPNHLKARLLLGRVYLDQNKLSESVEVLEAAYQYDERAARADLLKGLLALMELSAQDEAKQLEMCERILKVQADQPVATEKRNTIFIQRGDVAFAKGDYDRAAQAYQDAGYQTGIEKIRTAWLAARLSEIPILAAEEKWDRIIEVCEPLLAQFPDDETIKGHIENAHLQLNFGRKYNEALGALESGQQSQARKLLTEIVSDNPDYGRASLKLVEAMYGKVKISLPIPATVSLLTFLTSAFWTIIIVLSIGGWMFQVFLEALSEIWNDYQYVYIENFILFGIIVIPLTGALFNYYANRVVDAAYQIERGQFSYGKALWIHAVFGMGLFYLDKEARRKWIYAVVALLLPTVVLGQIFYGYSDELSDISLYTLGDLEIKETWIYLVGLVGLFYLLSFVDVLLICSKKRASSGNSTVISNHPALDTMGMVNEKTSHQDIDERHRVEAYGVKIIICPLCGTKNSTSFSRCLNCSQDLNQEQPVDNPYI